MAPVSATKAVASGTIAAGTAVVGGVGALFSSLGDGVAGFQAVVRGFGKESKIDTSDEGLATLFGIEAAAGTTATDALPAVTGHHSLWAITGQFGSKARKVTGIASLPLAMGIDFSLIANFAALALIALAGPAVVFILFYRRGAL